MGQILGGIVAVMQGIVALKSIGDQFTELWLTFNAKQIDEEYDDRIAKREMLTHALKTAPNDAARKQAARELYRLNTGN